MEKLKDLLGGVENSLCRCSARVARASCEFLPCYGGSRAGTICRATNECALPVHTARVHNGTHYFNCPSQLMMSQTKWLNKLCVCSSYILHIITSHYSSVRASFITVSCAQFFVVLRSVLSQCGKRYERALSEFVVCAILYEMHTRSAEALAKHQHHQGSIKLFSLHLLWYDIFVSTIFGMIFTAFVFCLLFGTDIMKKRKQKVDAMHGTISLATHKRMIKYIILQRIE